jgi:hypothetical protein
MPETKRVAPLEMRTKPRGDEPRPAPLPEGRIGESIRQGISIAGTSHATWHVDAADLTDFSKAFFPQGEKDGFLSPRFR